MRQHAEPLTQLGFPLGGALSDLVAEEPGAEEQRFHPVVQPLGGQRLRRAPATDHRVDPGTGPGDAVQRVTEFSQELRQKQFNGTNLFAEVRVGSSAIRGAGPAATLTWSVEADLRRLEP